MKDLISIIIPYFKKKEFFKETIESVKNQSYKNFEIILIYDDIDKTDLKFVKHTLKKIKYKKIIINKNNLGAGISRNLGIKKSKGKFIAFLDADDVWYKNKIKKQINFMRKKKVHFSFSNYSIINKNNKIIKIIKAPKQIKFIDLLFACDIGLSSVILESNLLKNRKFSGLKTKEDYLLWLSLAKDGIKMMSINETLVSWRKTDNSLSTSVIQKLSDAFTIYNKYLKFNFVKSILHVFALSLNFLNKRYL